MGDVHALVQALPCFISQIVISHQGECSPPAGTPIGDTADIAFGIRVQPLSEQQNLINDIRAQINPPAARPPPEGTTVQLAGASGARGPGEHGISPTAAGGCRLRESPPWDWCWPRSIARSARTLVPLIPVLMATGWSGLVVAALGVALNPMSATLGALVIAIATEFSVILSARYANERRAGLSVGESLRRTYLRTGAAVLASGVTAIAGFAVLAIAGLPLLDDIGLISVAPVLRDFGLVTVADLLVALAGVMLRAAGGGRLVRGGLPAPLAGASRAGWRPANPLRERPLGRGDGAGGEGGRGGDPGERPRRTAIYSLIVGMAVRSPDRRRRDQPDLHQEQGRPRGP